MRRLWERKPGRTFQHVLFWIVVIAAGNILLLELMLTLSGQSRNAGFTESFDDPRLLGWECFGHWRVVNGVLRLEPEGRSLIGYEWGNVSISVRARRWGNGSLTIKYRAGDSGSYDVHFGDLGVSLTRSIDGTTVELSSAPVSVPAGVWVTVHVIAVGNYHAVSLDGEMILEFSDPNPFRSSMIGLLNIGPGNASGEFDDLKVTGNSNPEVMIELPPGAEKPSPSS